MSSSKYKFLLDENVRIELYRFLDKQGVDVKFVLKGIRNGEIAKMSLKEQRLIVTNDQDFSSLTNEEVYGVIWLHIDQNDPDGLINAFSRLLDSQSTDFHGRLTILRKEGFDAGPLWEELRTKKKGS